MGFTPELVAVVWVGFDRPRSIGVSSSQGALPIWVNFAREALGERVRGRFLKPPDVVVLAIDPLSGALASSTCPRRRREYFVAGTEPTDICTFRGIRSGGPRTQRRATGILDWLRSRL